MDNKDTQERYTTPFSAEKNNTDRVNSKLIEYEKIEATPFGIAGNKERGYWVTFGRYRLTEPKETKEDALEEYNKEWCNLMILTMSIMIQIYDQEKQQQADEEAARIREEDTIG